MAHPSKSRGLGRPPRLRLPFVSEVRDLKASLEHGNVKEDFVEEAVQVFRFEPSRLELLGEDGAWSEPRRLMPY